MTHERELWQIRRWVEAAKQAIEQKQYDHAWTCCNQCLHFMNTCENDRNRIKCSRGK
jgi:hypothetical protein